MKNEKRTNSVSVVSDNRNLIEESTRDRNTFYYRADFN